MNTKNPKTTAGGIGACVRTLFQRSCLGTLALAALLGLPSSGRAQSNNVRCASQSIHQLLLATVPSYVTNRATLENFTTSFVNDVRSRGAEAMRDGIITIPVVVHVVYRTAAENISDAQIQSQIDVLNADFRALNTDIGGVPGVFQPLIGDQRVRFVLAARDPNCNPSTGITRTPTTRTSFIQDEAVKSAASGGHDAWPRDKYLNVWVCNLVGTGGGLIGYSQFPGGPPATDGVVIRHAAFGTTGTASAPFALGRSATHEIGHWLNLNHIWGDDGCGLNGDVVCGDGSSCLGTDNVDDTPNQAVMHSGCPSFPQISCGNAPNGDLFMNYMDYTDDSCMFMFTQGQVDRMNACLRAPSPAGRAEILGSDGAIPPTGVAGADLWAQDTPEDTGVEPNTASPWMYVSDDIWARVGNDGVANQDHQNPVYTGGVSPNYLYVRVRNRGCGASGSATVKLYWAKASSALGWPTPWNGTVTSPALMGGLIGSQATGSVAPGGYVILQFPWNPPNPADYTMFGGDKSHFCILARIETSSTAPYGMTATEGSDLNANVRNNNNIIWKNLSVVAGTGRSAATTMGNTQSQTNQNRLVFTVPANEHSVFSWGTATVNLGPTLFQKWQQAGSVGFGISVSNNLIQLLNPGAVIAGLQLTPGELETISVEFNRFPWLQPINGVFPLIVTQEQFRNGQYTAIGGNIFRVKDRFVAAQGCIDIQCPTNQVRYICGSNTIPVYYSVRATNNCNPTNLSVVTTPSSGSPFGLGTTTVDSWAYGSGQSNHCSFTVTVLPNPSCGSPTNCLDLHCSTNLTAYAPCGSNCVPVYYSAWAQNLCNPNDLSVTTYPASGDCFGLGNNTVDVWAYGSGQTNHCSFTVTVLPNANCPSNPTPCIDIHCPTNLTAYAPCGSNCVSVPFTVWATDRCSSNQVSVVTDKPSGYCFPVGTTWVNSTATGSGQSVQCSFPVTVLPDPNSNCGGGCSSNLLVNGSFETPGVPDGYVALPGGDPVIAGWVTMLNGVEYYNPAVTPSFVNTGFAADGVYLLDLAPANATGGGIRQTFATTPGQSYRVSFMMGTSKERGRNGTASLTATVAGTAHAFNLSTASPGIVWERKEFSFVASSTTTTLVFCTMDDPALSFVNLDDVRVSDCCQDPGLKITPTVTIEWKCGILQSAPEVIGPYTDVPGASSPYTIPTSDPRRFFRTRN